MDEANELTAKYANIDDNANKISISLSNHKILSKQKHCALIISLQRL